MQITDDSRQRNAAQVMDNVEIIEGKNPNQFDSLQIVKTSVR